MEVRGVGVLPFGALAYVEINQVIECAPADELERIPAPTTTNLCGVELPFCRLHAAAASAPEKAIVFCGASCV
jgi:hypothetical protein